eukprot:1150409-Pelagomonas_calceolata.AAC.1
MHTTSRLKPRFSSKSQPGLQVTRYTTTADLIPSSRINLRGEPLAGHALYFCTLLSFKTKGTNTIAHTPGARHQPNKHYAVDLTTAELQTQGSQRQTHYFAWPADVAHA